MRSELNDKEKRIVDRLIQAAPEGVTIAQLAQDCFGGQSNANSWVRNSVRKPCELLLIHQAGKGLYAAGAPVTVAPIATAMPTLTDAAVADTSTATETQPVPDVQPSPGQRKAKGSGREVSSPAVRATVVLVPERKVGRRKVKRARLKAPRAKATAPAVTKPKVERRKAKRSSRKVPRHRSATALHVKNFAQIASANIEFGDLTVLVGPQATGKSLFLQWLKIALDAGEVVHALREAGHDLKTDGALIDLVFGEGMSAAWTRGQTSVTLDGKSISPKTWPSSRKKNKEGGVFFIPAHRALLLAEGWPAPFMKLNADTPVVARLFSQNLYQRFSGRRSAALFPVERILKEQYRRLIDRAVFHGGEIELEKEGLRYRLRLVFRDGIRLPFMTWTAGQREFTPLLLGLYHVLPPRGTKKREDIDWVIIEEPEMGLHPQAITVFMLLVLDLLWRGYRVVVSTHSPLVLDIVWAIRRLAENKAPRQFLADAFAVDNSDAVRKVMEHALTSEYRVYFFDLDEKTHKVTARDISNLDPDAQEQYEADWGGLTGFSSRFGAAVRRAVNKAGK